MANEVAVEDENEGTILTFDDAENVSVEDIMYLLQGTGSNRDRKISLGALIAFLVANQKFTELKLVKDSENDISIKWDETNGEFVIWDRSNDNGKVVAVPKFHAHGNATFEKDVSVNADLAVTKTLDVLLGSVFHGMVECDDYIISKAGLDSKGKSVFQRINVNSDKCSFAVSTASSINTLVNNSGINVTVGDIVFVRNDGSNDITVTLGERQGSGGIETKTTTLKPECTMAFICNLKQTVQDTTYTQWSPLGNATVTWA